MQGVRLRPLSLIFAFVWIVVLGTTTTFGASSAEYVFAANARGGIAENLSLNATTTNAYAWKWSPSASILTSAAVATPLTSSAAFNPSSPELVFLAPIVPSFTLPQATNTTSLTFVKVVACSVGPGSIRADAGSPLPTSWGVDYNQGAVADPGLCSQALSDLKTAHPWLVISDSIVYAVWTPGVDVYRSARTRVFGLFLGLDMAVLLFALGLIYVAYVPSCWARDGLAYRRRANAKDISRRSPGIWDDSTDAGADADADCLLHNLSTSSTSSASSASSAFSTSFASPGPRRNSQSTFDDTAVDDDDDTSELEDTVIESRRRFL